MTVNPGPGQRLPWGRWGGGSGRRAGAGCPAGSSGEPWPAGRWQGVAQEGTWGRVFLADGATLVLPSQQGRPQAPCSLRLLNLNSIPREARTYLQFICVNYLLCLAASPAASLLPPPSCSSRLFHIPVCGGAPGLHIQEVPMSGPTGPRGRGFPPSPTFTWESLSWSPREHWRRSQVPCILAAVLSVRVTGNYPHFTYEEREAWRL